MKYLFKYSTRLGTLFSTLLLLIPILSAQNTVGLLSYEPSSTYDGFNLMYPHNQSSVFLLNNCGEVVHEWEDSPDFRPGNVAELLPDGKLVRAKRPADISNDPIWAGGAGAIVELVDWNENVDWSFELNNAEERLHHDIAVMNNGNILMVVWERKTVDELIQAGRDTSLISDTELWPEKIIEVNPSTDEIEWEWHAWDHLVQDFDASKDNFGVVADSPHKININFNFPGAGADWLHCNAIDYHEFNDQIMLSIPNFSEIWIISHNSTTEEAAGSRGDLQYRWGNPQAYEVGDSSDQKLFYQHDAHWNDDFLTPAHPYFDKILVFNNRAGEDFSTVNIIDHGYEMYEDRFPFSNNRYEPADFDLTVTHPTPTEVYSTGLSSVQCLPNENLLICSGRTGYTFELTPDQEIVWEYKTPILGAGGQSVPATQGDELTINQNLTFRFNRFPSTYSAFEGKDLSPKGFIELEPNTEFCDTLLSGLETLAWYELQVYPNPATSVLHLEWEGEIDNHIEVIDLTGKVIKTANASGGKMFMDVSDLQNGLYFVRINHLDVRKLEIVR